MLLNLPSVNMSNPFLHGHLSQWLALVTFIGRGGEVKAALPSLNSHGILVKLK